MNKIVRARFANGVLTPLEPLDLPDGMLVWLDIDPRGHLEPEITELASRILSDHRGFAAGIDPEKINQLNDDLMVEEYLQKERRIRKRNE